MRHGKLDCPEKGEWCIWVDLDTGACTKNGDCDVGSEAWRVRRAEADKAVLERRRKAEENRKIEEIAERNVVTLKRERTERQDITFKIQQLEMQKNRYYQRGQVQKADNLLYEIVKLQKKLEELKK